MFSIAMSGVAMEAGAVAAALSQGAGVPITERIPASPRTIIYGQQKVGGVFLFLSTTGSTSRQFNHVIVWAAHECHSIQSLWLDGRMVFWDQGSVGNVTRNGVNFGGNADSNQHPGPTGDYNFGGLVFCDSRFGDQVDGDVMGSLTANDPSWTSSPQGSPWCGGNTYSYVKIEGDAQQFPQQPGIKATINGKNTIFDPRTNTTSFTNNWALCLADFIQDPIYGLGDKVNTAQLIAAANICDERVILAAGGTEARYTLNYHFDTSMAPGSVIDSMLSAAGGRIAYIGGEWYIFPAAWTGPTASLDDSNITAEVQWKPYRTTRELINRVTTTFTAPVYPYSTNSQPGEPNTSNLYDGNGFFNGVNGTVLNSTLNWETTDSPMYACDTLHGFPDDQFLMEDGGIERPLDLTLPGVVSLGQTQRLQKIALLRNRQQGTGSIEFNLAAFGVQACDTIQLTTRTAGWTGKVLEVVGTTLSVADGQGGDAPSVRYKQQIQETDPSVYEWSTTDELTIYANPANPAYINSVPTPPTNMQVNSGEGFNIIQPDGSVEFVIEVTWDTPQDPFAQYIQVQYLKFGNGYWTTAPLVDIAQTTAIIGPVVAGSLYNVQIRTIRYNGAPSPWVEVTDYQVATVTSFLGTLGAEIPTIQANSALGGTVPGELIANPNFVNGLTSWTIGGGTMAIDANQHKLGTKSLRLLGGNLYQMVQLTAGHTYTFQAWVMTDGSVINGGSEGIGIYFYDPTSQITIQKVNQTLVNLGNTFPGVIIPTSVAIPWTLVQITVSVATTGMYRVTLSDNYSSNASNANTWFDGISLVDTTGAADVTSAQPIVYTGSSESIVPNGNFILGNLQGWNNTSFAFGLDGNGIRIYSPPNPGGADDHAYSPSFAIIPGAKYRFVYRAYNGSGSGGIFFRLAYSATYAAVVDPAVSPYLDFLAGGVVNATPTNYTYDWIAPAGANYASMCVYATAASDLAIQSLACYPYVAVNEWGADVTSNNESATTSSIANHTLDDLPDGTTYRKPSHIGPGGIYYASTAFVQQGSIVNTLSSGIFNFEVNNNSISCWTYGETLYFSDGSSIYVPPYGNASSPYFHFTGLAASTNYYISAYWDIPAQQLRMIMSDVSGGTAVPSALQICAVTNGDGHISLSVGRIVTTTNSSTSSGGGGGAGGNPTCPAEDQLMEVKELGFAEAVNIEPGMHVRDSDGGWNEVYSAHSVEAYLHHVTINVGDDDETYHVDLMHQWLRPGGDAMSEASGPDWIRSITLKVGDQVQGADGVAYTVTAVSEPHLGKYRKLRCERQRMRLGKLVAHNWNTAG